jgi:hypothetical protein
MRSAFYFDPHNSLIRRDDASRRHGDHEGHEHALTTEDTEDIKIENAQSSGDTHKPGVLTHAFPEPMISRWLPVHATVTLLAAFELAACYVGPLPELGYAEHVRAECPVRSGPVYYFPEGSLLPDEDLSRDFELRWDYSSYLTGTAAPSLSCGKSNDSYRFLWVFPDRPALLASVTQVKRGWLAEGVQFMPNETGLLSAVDRPMQRMLSDDDVQPLFVAVEKVRFWNRASVRLGEGAGSRWIIEGRRGTGYRVHVRASRTDESFVLVAQTLVRLTGMTVPAVMHGGSK